MKLASASFLRSMLLVAGLSALLGLSACHRTKAASRTETPDLPCKVYGASDKAIIAMQADFNKNGIRVISIGQNYLISIPSAMLFTNQSPHLKWASYGLLNNVVCYLKQFRKVAVTVTTYSSKYLSFHREKALTLTRSRAVGDYLWSQGIDSRFIFTQGLASDKPIISSLAGGDGSPNSRVEISFRRAVK